MRLPSARPWKPGYPVGPPVRAAMRRHGGPAKRARRRGIMCPSPHQGGTDRGCTLRPSVDLAPVQKRLRTFSAQFYDFRLVRAKIAAARRRTLCIMVRIVRRGKEMRLASVFDKGVTRMTQETLMIKNALIARLIAAKLAAIKASGGDVDSR